MRLLPLAAALVLAAAAPATAATWTVDPAKSTLGFAGTQTGEGFTGRFKTWTGTIDYDPAKPEAAHVSISIDTGSAATGDPQRDEAMPGEDWFDASKSPKATFEATGFTPKGGDQFETAGTLTIRGAAKPVTLPFTLKLDGDTAHATGKATLTRTTWGVGQGDWASDQYVGFGVDVTLDLTAKRQP
ncbi:YceI family protein [Lichenihabitans sp. Uapishka_5]|nr:YceI family protein [Lichenihabitans sp. Uapishka_5]